jgi:hypothetical protein
LVWLSKRVVVLTVSHTELLPIQTWTDDEYVF